MPKLAVVDGAILKCVVGSAPSPLSVTVGPQTKVNGARLATILDNTPCVNISPFGSCQITGGPCGPVTPTPWLPGVSTTIPAKYPVLVEGSILPCSIGGVIQILNPGQSFVYVDAIFPPGFEGFVKALISAAHLKATIAKLLREAAAFGRALQLALSSPAAHKDGGPGFVKSGGSIALDLTPFVGTGKGIIEAFTGKDLVTGQHLALWERALGAVPVVGKYGKRGVDVVEEGAKPAKKVFNWVKKKLGGGDEPKKHPSPPPKPKPPPRMYVPQNVANHVPHGWQVKPTEKGGGTVFINPAHPNQRIRYMPGNPRNQHANSRVPYVVVTDKAGRNLQADGSLTPSWRNPKNGEVLPRGNKRHASGHQSAGSFQGNLGD